MTPHARFMAAARLYGAPYGVTPEMLMSQCRLGIVVAVRGLLIHHCRHIFGWSLLKIGRKLGKDHTTALNALRRGPGEWAARARRYSTPVSVKNRTEAARRNGGHSQLIACQIADFFDPPAANDDRPQVGRAMTWEDALRMSADWGRHKAA